MIIIIVLGVIILLKNLLIEPITYSSFLFPVLYIATGSLGLSYLKYKDDTYATIFKILIWIEIIINILALIILVLFTFLIVSVSVVGECNSQGQFCTIGIDGRESCNKSADCETTKSYFSVATIVFVISIIIYLVVTILMCVTLSHFKKLEEARKSHHYSAV